MTATKYYIMSDGKTLGRLRPRHFWIELYVDGKWSKVHKYGKGFLEVGDFAGDSPLFREITSEEAFSEML